METPPKTSNLELPRLVPASQTYGTSGNLLISGPKYKTNVIGVLLYGSESWKVTNTTTQKLDTSQTRCPHRILKIFWPNKISNEELYLRTQTAAISDQIKEKR
jgi:hypothetical protein